MDETEKRGDTSQSGDSSSETKGTPIEPETFNKTTQEKAINDALSAAGRTAKELTDKTQKAETLLTEAKKIRETAVGEQSRWQKEKDEKELESAKDNPDALTAITARQKLQTKESELSKKEQELSDKETKIQPQLDELATSKKERNALEIALKHNVPFETLLKFTDGSLEAMEDLAKLLSRKGGTTTLKPDSGTTTGGGDLSAEDKLKERFPKMLG